MDEKTIKLTNHGRKRIVERSGLPKKAAQANAQKAFDEGLDRTELSGSIRRYADLLYYQSYGKTKRIKIYSNMVYIFEHGVLITSFPLPTKYVKTAQKIKEKKRKEGEDIG